MWQKIFTALGGVAIEKLIVLLKDGGKALLQWSKERLAERKKKKEADRKIKEHQDAKTKDESRNTYNNLP